MNSTFPRVNEAAVIVIIHPLYSIWCFIKWHSTIYTEAVGYVSHLLESIFATHFKATYFVPLMFGKDDLGSIHHKSIKSKIPLYFKDQSVPINSYTYTTPMPTKIFSHKKVLQDLSIGDFKTKPLDCPYGTFPFIYNPTGYAISGVINNINHTSFWDVFAKGPNYREPKSINWKHNFKLLMDSVEDYTRQSAKCGRRI